MSRGRAHRRLGLLIAASWGLAVLSSAGAAETVARARTGLVEPGALRLEGETRSRVRFIAGAPLAQFYPADAMGQGVAGVVVLDLLIDTDGRVKRAVAVSETPGGAGFGDAAVEAARTFQFANGLLRPVLLMMQIRFDATG